MRIALGQIMTHTSECRCGPSQRVINALVFAADLGGNVYCSPDNGQTWNSVTTLRAPVVDLRTQSSEIWALTDGAGIVRLTGSCP